MFPSVARPEGEACPVSWGTTAGAAVRVRRLHPSDKIPQGRERMRENQARRFVIGIPGCATPRGRPFSIVLTLSGVQAMLETRGGIMSSRATRSEKLDLRLTPDAKTALQKAAAASHRSVS